MSLTTLQHLQKPRIPRAGLVCWHELYKPNILLQSNQFDTTWAPTRATSVQAAAQTAPSGSLAWKLVEDDSAATTHYYYQVFTFQAATYSYKIWAKAGERTWIQLRLYDGTNTKSAYFNLSAGATGTKSPGVTSSCTANGGGYDCVMTVAMAAGSGYAYAFIAEGDNDDNFDGTGSAPYTEDDPGLYIADAQLYPSATLPPYEATTTLQSFTDLSNHGYTLTRGSNASAADTNDPTVLGPGCSFVDDDYMLTGALSGVAATSNTWIVAAKSAYDADSFLGGINYNQTTQNFGVLRFDASTVINAWTRAAGNVETSGALTIADETVYAFAMVTTADGSATVSRLDNQSTSTATAAQVPTVSSSRLVLGDYWGGSGVLNDGTIYESLLYNRVLSNAEQQRIYRELKRKWSARGVTIT